MKVSNPQLFSAKHLPQFVLGVFQSSLLLFRKIFSGTIYVEIQHRHGRLVWRSFSSFAPLGGMFE